MAMDINLQKAVHDIRQGKPVVLLDNPSRENEGDLVLAGERVTVERLQFFAKYANDILCVSMQKERLAALGLEPQPRSHNGTGCNFYTSVDCRHGGSGQNPHDRAQAVHALMQQQVPVYHLDSLLKTPGHVHPLGADPRGVLGREGHTEGALDLVKLAGLYPLAVLSEVMDRQDGDTMKRDQLKHFSREHGLTMVHIDDIVRYGKTQ